MRFEAFISLQTEASILLPYLTLKECLALRGTEPAGNKFIDSHLDIEAERFAREEESYQRYVQNEYRLFLTDLYWDMFYNSDRDYFERRVIWLRELTARGLHDVASQTSDSDSDDASFTSDSS